MADGACFSCVCWLRTDGRRLTSAGPADEATRGIASARDGVDAGLGGGLATAGGLAGGTAMGGGVSSGGGASAYAWAFFRPHTLP